MNVGVLGGGQLGRMLALAGIPLGLRFRFLEPAGHPPVAGLGDVVRGTYDDIDTARAFAHGLDVVTYEFENVPVETVDALSEQVPVHPPPAALRLSQDRLVEKEGFRALGIPTAPYVAVDTRADLHAALVEIGLPAVLKTRRMGYDGKGQAVLRHTDEVDRVWTRLGSAPLLLEGWVPFTRELSIIGARDGDGHAAFYPLIETHHEQGILRLALAPAESSSELQGLAERHARRLMDHLDYVGVLALELFDTPAGLLANEMAPRVHNSGHWTQDGAVVSQFENHVRAVCGFPLGSARALGHAAMINLLGTLPDMGAVLGLAGAHAHLYGKSPRPGRKLGHVNVQCGDRAGVRRAVDAVLNLLNESHGARSGTVAALQD